MAKSMVLRDRPNDSSNNEEDHDDAGEDHDEGVKDSRNEPTT